MRAFNVLYKIMVICFLTFLLPVRPHPTEKSCRLDTRSYFLTGIFLLLAVPCILMDPKLDLTTIYKERRIIKSLYRIMVICFSTFLVPLRPHSMQRSCRLDTCLYCLSVCLSVFLSLSLSGFLCLTHCRQRKLCCPKVRS